jgi:plastocyanin
VGLLLVAGALGACGNGSPVTPAVACTATNAPVISTVLLLDMYFVPDCMRVTVGNSLTFFDADDVVHEIAADATQPESFDSGPLSLDATYTHEFSVAGTYTLECTVHIGTTATVFVEPP